MLHRKGGVGEAGLGNDAEARILCWRAVICVDQHDPLAVASHAPGEDSGSGCWLIDHRSARDQQSTKGTIDGGKLNSSLQLGDVALVCVGGSRGRKGRSTD